MPAGRPLKFKTPEELQEKIDAYFSYCDKGREVEILYKGKPTKVIRSRPITVTGLANFLDTTRDTLLDYEKLEDRAEFSDTIKRAKMRCHQFAEEQLFENSPAGPIFSLKNNWGWKDKTEVDQNISGELKVNKIEIIDA